MAIFGNLPRNNKNGSKLYKMSTLKLVPWYMSPLSELGRNDSIIEVISVCCVGAVQSVTVLIVVNHSVRTDLI